MRPTHATVPSRIDRSSRTGQTRLVLTGVLIIHGRDATADIEVSRTLASVIPDAELVVFEETGREPTMTRAHQVVGAISRRLGADRLTGSHKTERNAKPLRDRALVRQPMPA